MAVLCTGCSDPSARAELAETSLSCMQGQNEEGVAVRDSAGVRVVINLTPGDPEDLPRIAADPDLVLGTGAAGAVAASGDAAAPQDAAASGASSDAAGGIVFGRIAGAVLLSDGRIVVADAHDATIHVFDRSGRRIIQAGGEGSGPGEFRSISGVHRLAGDTLLVQDGRGRRITRFSPALDVEGVHTTYLPRPGPTGAASSGSVILRVIGAFADGTLLAASRGDSRDAPRTTSLARDSLLLWRFDPESMRGDSLGLVLGTEWFTFFGDDGTITFGKLPVGYRESVAVAGDRYFYGSGGGFEIGEYSRGGELRRLIRVCEDRDRIEAHHVDSAIERYLDLLPQSRRRLEEQALRGIPWPDVAPSFLRLLTDASGRLWAQDFTLPGEPQRWRIFAPGGRWLGDVEIPAGVDPLAIGPEHLLGRYTNRSGVESVRLYSLLPADDAAGS